MGIGIVIAAAIAGAAAFAHFGSEGKLHRHVVVEVAPVALPTEPAALERGGYLYRSRGCADCHGADGAGKVVLNEDGFYAKAPQITPGEGSVTANYRLEDWIRTIRHGVKPNGEPVFAMPSEDFNRLTDADTGAIVAYVRAMPVVMGRPAEFRMPLLVRFLYAAGLIRDAAEKIDHSLPPRQPVLSDDVTAQGAYVAEGCKGCHNASLSGGAIPGAPPSWPAAANLTSGQGGVLPRYATAQSLAAMFRSGMRPDGSAVSAVMPFGALREMSDADISALFVFLKTLPPAKTGEHL